MPERKPTGQEDPEPHETHGDDDLAAAIDDAAQTGSHAVVETGFAQELPDDADDVRAGAAEPIASPRVGAEEQVIVDRRRRVRRGGPGGVQRSTPGR